MVRRVDVKGCTHESHRPGTHAHTQTHTHTNTHTQFYMHIQHGYILKTDSCKEKV
jgi:hypothetical protein